MNPNKPAFDGTIDVPVSQHLQGTETPFKFDRGIAEGILKQAFQPHDPDQQTAAIKVDQRELQQQEQQFNPQELAAWYKSFPINPRQVVKQYQMLEQSMAYALTGLNEAIPPALVEEHQKVVAQMRQYSEAQVQLLRSSSPDIKELEENFFTDHFTTVCARLLNDMKALGESLYLRLNEKMLEEQRQAFQVSQGARQVRARFPFLANRFETSPGPLEKAKREYEKEIGGGIDVDCHQVYMKLKDKTHVQEQYPQNAVREYIKKKTIAAIHRAVEQASLPDEVKTALYQQLPKAVHSFSVHNNTAETASYLKLDRVLTRAAENDNIIKTVLAALIRGLALTYAAYGNEERNEQILWTYSYALQPGHINFFLSGTSEHNGTTADTIYVRYPKPGTLLTQEGFFHPMEWYDDSFIPDYLTLARGNKKLEFVSRQIQDGFSSQQSNKNTAMHQGGALELFQRSMANRELLAGYSTQSQPEGVTGVNNVNEAITKLNNLRADSAMAIHALMEKITSLEEENGRLKQNLQNANHFKGEAQENARQQKHRADKAEKTLKEAREEFQDFIQQVMITCSNINTHADSFLGGKAEIKKIALELHQKAATLKSEK